VKLYARTHGGTGLGLDIRLTGQLKESDGKIRSVEVTLPSGCDQIVGYTFEPLPKTPGGSALLWADPGDVCTDRGDVVSPSELRDEAARVREQARVEMLRGPLGENWP
jgi:hypothetical protein